MRILKVTFSDQAGQVHAGELVNAATITFNNGTAITAMVDRASGGEVAVLTLDPQGGWIMHQVQTENIRTLRPIDL